MQILSEQEQQRREKLEELKKLGIEPYPAQTFKVSHDSLTLINALEEGIEAGEKAQGEFEEVAIAGRMMSHRVQGATTFADLQDEKGRIQLYINRDELCPGEDKTFYNTVFKKLLDIGDHIAVEGFMFKTKMGEVTLHVKKLTLLSKSLKPLPLPKIDKHDKVHDAFTDTEQRYRQRYVDLVINSEVKDVFIKRSQLIATMRDFLTSQGYLEVETPILQPIYGGALARPFKTHHNTLDMTLYMRIANELYLKRLIVGGFSGVFEFAKDFRNEGMSRFHNPEFTQVEVYVAYKDYEWMMKLTERMIERVAINLHGSTVVTVGENKIDFKRPWKRFTMFEAIEHFTGIDISEMDEIALREVCKKLEIPVDDTMGKGKLIDEIFGEKCEANLIQPTFITDYPVEMSPLAKKHRDKEGMVERFEVICNGKEICNAFSELNDPLDQRKRFEEQLELGKRGDEEAMMLDEDYLRALEYGMPPTAGLGVGIDRLTMIMTNQPSIQEVLLFPQMRPEKKVEMASIEDYKNIGIREELIPILHKLHLFTIEQVKKQEPNKLHNDVCGMRKKMKLKEVKNPSKEEVEQWLA